ncbi:hypothetical protein HanXRQr2_Chr16g0728721 [Helianthus annuus]|uniref:Uncharacterized protein n=1 Tax=Helianthus annuus TaxID=4232 RepID=A0A9K3GWF2_HELAN|nr:hypothetical protein HanXRQr2_Chr16g0728721 [Helianthus annuus]KAJ0819656.1 hypothetical protein HanPSC8_Chr16g0698561 [Helianthus annuus]
MTFKSLDKLSLNMCYTKALDLRNLSLNLCYLHLGSFPSDNLQVEWRPSIGILALIFRYVLRLQVLGLG